MAFLAPPGYQPMYNPSIPYLGPIHGGLREGTSIYIQGSVPEDITRFFINLRCAESESSDVALHFNPRFDGWDKVVFNTCENGSWGSEDKIRDMPFSKGEPFEMVIITTSKGYQIKVNKKDFYTFEHRIPIERVCTMQIAGDVSIKTINVIGGGTAGIKGGEYPKGGKEGGHAGDTEGLKGGGYPGLKLPVMDAKPIYDPPVPCSNPIPGGMFPKRTIIIRGNVPYGAYRFTINFVVSRTRDIAFHMNPRVQDETVVRNSMIEGDWGWEETDLDFNPFEGGEYFDMSIRCGSEKFKVFVNGLHFCEYSHRFKSVTEIDKLEIAGDVYISYIHF